MTSPLLYQEWCNSFLLQQLILRNLLHAHCLFFGQAVSREKARRKDPEKGIHGDGLNLLLQSTKWHQNFQCGALPFAWAIKAVLVSTRMQQCFNVVMRSKVMTWQVQPTQYKTVALDRLRTGTRMASISDKNRVVDRQHKGLEASKSSKRHTLQNRWLTQNSPEKNSLVITRFSGNIVSY